MQDARGFVFRGCLVCDIGIGDVIVQTDGSSMARVILPVARYQVETTRMRDFSSETTK